jgi:predicted amidohydrolase
MQRFCSLLAVLMATAISLKSIVSAGESDWQLSVAAVQMRSSHSLDENLPRILESIRAAAAEGSRVVVFPECALTGYYDEVAEAVTEEALRRAEEEIAETCREAGIAAVVGTAWWQDGEIFNTALIINPEGEVIERYHKVQLAEDWPKGGDHLVVFHIDGIPCSVIICHDERYPELVRLPVLAGARVLFYISHESGLRKEHKIDPYRAQIRARAVENRIYVVQANAPANMDMTGSHGQSRIINPDGNVMTEASIFEEDVVTATLNLDEATGSFALRSVNRGPLGDWWKSGLEYVRVIGGPDFQPIYNGHDLSGWTVEPDEMSGCWVSDNGILKLQSVEAKTGSILWTEKEYTDFEMDCEFRFGEGTIDSGIFLRNDREQIQIGISGSLKRDMTASPYISGKGYPVEAENVDELLKPDGWNHLRIRARGGSYTTWLNGQKVMNYESETAVEKGRIGIQIHSKRDMSIDYQNIRLAELD